MIKYKIQTGDKVLNMKAQAIRDQTFKPSLKGMNCRKCSVDTVIEFLTDGTSYPRHSITPCCEDFRQRINQKLGII